MSITLRGGHRTADRRLDRIPFHDERSRNFPLRAMLTTAQQKAPRSYTWSCAYFLDQGQEGACTGFAVTHEAGARPVVAKRLSAAVAQDVYHRARELDDWPGENYEGSSVLGAIKAGKEKGWYGEYRWAFGLDDLILAVGYKGPAVLGVNWYDQMFQPSANGYISASGQVAGGHAILCNGVDVKKKCFRLHNSWGTGWGVNGECFITFADMDKLLREYGEACIPIQRYAP